MQHIKKTPNQRGDTLIEVLVAITVLGVVIVGAFSLMNRGVAQMYDSMEKSEVRMLLNGQIEMLTYARDQHFRSLTPDSATMTDADKAANSVWSALQSQSVSDIPSLNDGCVMPGSAFWVGIESSGTITYHNTLEEAISDEFPVPGSGIWIQKINSGSGAGIPYKDFYIRACWRQTSSTQTQVLSTVVRLYDQ